MLLWIKADYGQVQQHFSNIAFYPPRPFWSLSPIPQRFILPLARLPSYSSLVGFCSIESSQRSNPAEQLGAHSGFGFCCLAELVSEGIPGCSASTFGAFVSLAQPLKSSASTISISARKLDLLFCIFLHLVCCRDPALGFLQAGQGYAARYLAHFGAVVGEVCLRLCCYVLCDYDAHLLPTGHNQQGQRQIRPRWD
jgi:hypothetical protein